MAVALCSASLKSHHFLSLVVFFVTEWLSRGRLIIYWRLFFLLLRVAVVVVVVVMMLLIVAISMILLFVVAVMVVWSTMIMICNICIYYIYIYINIDFFLAYETQVAIEANLYGSVIRAVDDRCWIAVSRTLDDPSRHARIFNSAVMTKFVEGSNEIAEECVRFPWSRIRLTVFGCIWYCGGLMIGHVTSLSVRAACRRFWVTLDDATFVC